MPSDALPDFDPKKFYLVSGKTLNEFKKVIRRDRPDVVTGTAIKVASQNDDGTYLSVILPAGLSNVSGTVGTLNINVCINNVATPVRFLVAS